MSSTPNAIYSHKKFKKAALDAEKRSTVSVTNVNSTEINPNFSKPLHIETNHVNFYQRRSSEGHQNASKQNGEFVSTEKKHIFKPRFQANSNSTKSQDDSDIDKTPSRPPLLKQFSVDSVIYNKTSSSKTLHISDSSSLKGVSWKGLNSPSLEEVSQHITHLIDQNAAIVEYNKPEKLGKLKRYPSLGSDVDTRPVKRSNNAILPLFDKKLDMQPQDLSHQTLEAKTSYHVVSEETFIPSKADINFQRSDVALSNAHAVNSKVMPQLSANNFSLKSGGSRSPTALVDKKKLIISAQDTPSSPIFTSKSNNFSKLQCHKPELPLNFSSRVEANSQLSYLPTPKANSNHVYGGEVKIYGNVCKTLIIDSATTTAPSLDLCIAAKQLSAEASPMKTTHPVVVTFVESGLNSGGTMVNITKTPTTPKSLQTTSDSFPSFFPQTPPIQLPKKALSSSRRIVSPVPFADRAKIKYVPGIPGPYSEPMEYFPIVPPPRLPRTQKEPIKKTISDSISKPKTLLSMKPENSITDKKIPSTKLSLPLDERPNSLKLLSPGNPISCSALIGSTLVSPDTPRPKKSCGQHYLDGSIYTSLNMKVTTRTFYCCIFMPQPMYFLQPANSKVSMYSNWQIRRTDDPLNISPVEAMGLYRLSVHNNSSYTIAQSESKGIVSPSSYWYESQKVKDASLDSHNNQSLEMSSKEPSESSSDPTRSSFSSQTDGGSPERYVRGRGRGRFICDICGIRCHKPSMLKKHRRTHSNIRPYRCSHCVFSFKTKGNLTKHLKSKTHFKKCSTLNIDPSNASCSSDHKTLSSDEVNSDHPFDEDREDNESEDSEYFCDNDSSNSSRDLRTYTTIPRAPSQNGFNYPSDVSEDHPMDLSMKSSSDTGKSKSPSEPHETMDNNVLPPITQPCEVLRTIYSHSKKVSASDGTVLQRNLSELQGKSENMFQKYLEELALYDVAKKTQYIKPPEETARESSGGDPNVSTSHTVCVDEVMKEPEMVKSEASEKSPVAFPSLAANITVINSSRENDGISFMSPSGKLPSTGSSSYFDELASEDGKCMCKVCHKEFSRRSQLSLHMHIHAFERPHRCESCGISFRSKGHLSKHMRSVTHSNKVSINNTFGTPSEENPRPFKCDDCSIAFRIHGHLAKHLRSKLHVMKLECMGKVPFGIYAELERSGRSLHDIDTTDCDTSLESFQTLASRLFDEDGSVSAPRANKEPKEEKSNDLPEESEMKHSVAMDQDKQGQ